MVEKHIRRQNLPYLYHRWEPSLAQGNLHALAQGNTPWKINKSFQGISRPTKEKLQRNIPDCNQANTHKDTHNKQENPQIQRPQPKIKETPQIQHPEPNIKETPRIQHPQPKIKENPNEILQTTFTRIPGRVMTFFQNLVGTSRAIQQVEIGVDGTTRTCAGVLPTTHQIGPSDRVYRGRIEVYEL